MGRTDERDAEAGVREDRPFRWWYVAACAVMAIALGAYYVAIKAYPSPAVGQVVPGLLVTLLLLAGVAYRLRVVDSAQARPERTALATAAALSVVTVLLHWFVVADGPSAATVLTGVLPALPFLLLGWKSARR